MDLYESIQQEAMRAVIEPTDDDWLRRIFRYYSKAFATPLHQVQDLPLEDVLRAYFEDVYGEMDEAAREESIEWLLMTPEERAKNKDVERVLGQRDEEFLDRINAEVTSGATIERKSEEPKLEPKSMTKLAQMVERTKKRALKIAGTQLPSAPAVPAKPPLKTTKEPAMLGDLPEINVDFKKSGNLGGNSWADLDPLAPPRKSKKT